MIIIEISISLLVCIPLDKMNKGIATVFMHSCDLTCTLPLYVHVTQ